MFSFIRRCFNKNTTESKREAYKDFNRGKGLSDALMRNSIFPFFTLEDAENFSHASYIAKAAYKNKIERANRFLEYVAKGQQQDAEKILIENPKLAAELLSIKGNATDHSGRIFKNITALQYACWAWDRHMWEILGKYISKQVAAKQVEELESVGVEYQLPVSADQKPETIREKHYNFNEYIAALQNLVDVCYAYGAGTKSFNDMYKAEHRFGRAECHVPAHVANEYCHPDRSFESVPDFKDKNLPRTFRVQIWDSGWKDTVWFPITVIGELSYASRGSVRDCGLVGRGASSVPLDLAAMTALFKVRTLEFTQLKDFLLLNQETDSTLKFSLSKGR